MVWPNHCTATQTRNANDEIERRNAHSRRCCLWPHLRRARLGHAVNDDTPELRPYLPGSDVMATWHRVTGWIPPSRDPRYIKKWLDFQLDMLECRRRAIEAQFSLNFLQGSNDEERPQSTYGPSYAAHAMGRTGAVPAPLFEEASVGQSWARRTHGQDDSGAEAIRREIADDALMAAALDVIARSNELTDTKTTT